MDSGEDQLNRVQRMDCFGDIQKKSKFHHDHVCNGAMRVPRHKSAVADVLQLS